MSAPPDYSEAVLSPEGEKSKENPPPYSPPIQQPIYQPPAPSYPPGLQQPANPPGPQQPSYPTGPQPMTYPPQHAYPVQYPTQQTGHQTQITVAQYGGIVTTAPNSTVILRNTNVQPNDHMGFAIFVTLCCCLPFGIIGIIKASEAKNRWAVGDAAGAHMSSNDAKRWSTYGLVWGIMSLVIAVIVCIVRVTLSY